MRYFLFLTAAIFSGMFLVFFQGCSGVPPAAVLPAAVPQSTPRAAMVFDRAEASGPDNITLYFLIHASNPGSEGVTARLEKSRVVINGKEFAAGFSSRAEETRIDPGAGVTIKAECVLDLKNLNPSLPPETAALDTTTIMELAFTFDGGGQAAAVTAANFSFPWVKEPVFSIVSIAIMQAELINTRFKVKVLIQNPNPFPLTLSSFKYELYGHGRFWADGSKTDVYTIPENGKAEEDLFLLMNFINMRRDLLDQVIALQNVRYRFKGTAEIGTGVEHLPFFGAAFDIQGDSQVVK
jgi:LEA14-like dessication related protein